MSLTPTQRTSFHKRIDQLAILDPPLARALLNLTASCVHDRLRQAPVRLRRQAQRIGTLRLEPQLQLRRVKGGR